MFGFRGFLVGAMIAAMGSAPLQAAAASYSVLVFSKTAGFRHDSIPAGISAIQQLGAANDFTVEATEDANAFNDTNLARFKAVVWLSTTGDVLNDAQQAAFERYIRAGGGYAGIHAAADTEYGWAWYGRLVGAYFASHPSNQNATVKVEDPAHPSTKDLPAKWSRFDEWYNFQTNPRGTAHVLASLDESTYSGGSMGSDHPTAWCQRFDGGRSWYTGGGHTNESFADSAFRTHILGGIQTAAGVVASDCGASLTGSFQKVALDSNTNNPMELDVAPDGRVFYIERDGRLRVIKPDTQTTVTAGTLQVFTGNEDGLLGLTLDPGFATNKWVYLYYSPAGATAQNRLSRFTINGDALDLASEKVLLTVATQRNTCCHAGGSLTFDGAGNIYLATGDNTNPFESNGYTPIDERAGRQDFDAQRTAGNTNDLRGKVLRVKPQADGTYTIPASNLFTPGTAQTRAEIYAMGLRNPFRIGTDPRTNTLYVADYGPDAGQSNPDRGPGNTVEWNIVSRPGNYGWPYCVGDNYAYRDFTFPSGPSGPAFNCGAPVNNSPNNTGLTNLPAAIASTVDYDYDGNPRFPEIGGGGAPMGGPVYRYDPTSSSARRWPAYFDGKALFGEWNQSKLYAFQVTDQLVDINRLLDGISTIRPMDLEFGPDGAMYLIEWGSGFGGNNDDSGVYRIDYKPTAGRAPVAVASGQPTTGAAPLTVQFSSAGSNDPDGQPITYSWAFGDGGTSTAANPSHTYNSSGSFTAQLTVRDTEGLSAVANVPITVGNTAPTVRITLPANGSIFDWGGTIGYTITVTDPDEAHIDCAKVVMQYSLGHDAHAHPIRQQNGCGGSILISGEGGHGADANTFAVLEASYVDSGGLTGRSLIQLTPRRKQAEYFTATGGSGGGVQKENTGDPQGGFQNIGWIENNDWWSYDPVNLTGIGSLRLRAASGSQGGTVEVRQGSAVGALLGSATVPGTGGWQTYTDVTVNLSPSTSTAALYFVAKSPNGGGLFNVNWIDFVAASQGPALSPNVHLFYYSWYGATNGYRHWQQGGHTPPNDIGANLYPTLGPYDSGDFNGAVAQHMAWVRQSGAGVIVYSWWGQGSYEDTLAQGTLDAAQRQGIKVAWHMEPYGGRTAASTVADINYLNNKFGSHPALFRYNNKPTYYIFDSLNITDWSALGSVNANNVILAQTTDTSKIAGFSGMYTYDAIAGATAPGWAQAGAYAKANNLIWAPSVGPGYVDDRAVPGNTTPTLGRANGSTYDTEWTNALDLAKGGLPTWVSVTSFNEWHEGSTIEPARGSPPGGFGYETYEGAYGKTGLAAESAYLDRTAYWVSEFERRRGGGGTNLALNKPATADSQCHANEGPSKAVNGSVSGGTQDKWCSLGSNKWLRVDLGAGVSLSRFVVKHSAAGGEAARWNTRDFDIQVSSDGTAWSTVVSVRGNTADTTAHQVSPRNARYVRLVVLTPTQDADTAARIYEFEVYQ